jgi:hypothetical protein
MAISQLGRSSAAYITNIAGKGARHEGQTVEKRPPVRRL